MYALAKICQVKLKRPVEKYPWYYIGSRHASQVSRACSAISDVDQCVTGPSDMSVRHSLWIYLTLIGQENVNGAALAF